MGFNSGFKGLNNTLKVQHFGTKIFKVPITFRMPVTFVI